MEGKPLCAWTLEAAKEVSEIDEVYVSTENDEIIKTVQSLNLGIKIVKRPPELATDTATTESVMLHFAKNIQFDILITLQATSPLTRPEDIRNGLRKFEDEELRSAEKQLMEEAFYDYKNFIQVVSNCL